MSEPAADPVGLSGESFDFVVELGKVREFATATYAANDAYYRGSTPAMPPTFLAAAALWTPYEETLLERTGRDVRRTLHGEQEFSFVEGPPRAGTRLTGHPRIEHVYSRQGRRGGALKFYVLVTEFRDESGDIVAVSRTTVVETETPPEHE
jgi:hypothetical protein